MTELRDQCLAKLDQDERKEYDLSCKEFGFDIFLYAGKLANDLDQWVDFIIKLRSKGRFNEMALRAEGKEVMEKRFETAMCRAQAGAKVAALVIATYLKPRGLFASRVMDDVFRKEKLLIIEEQVAAMKRHRTAMQAVAREGVVKVAQFYATKDSTVGTISEIDTSKE